MDFKKKLYKRHDVFLSWIFSYIIVLTVPLFISGIVYVESGRIIINEMNNANGFMLEQARNVIDSQLQEIDSLFNEIAFNPKVKKLIYLDEPFQNYQYYETYELTKDFRLYLATNRGVVQDIYIYLMKNDIIISSKGVLDNDLAYDKFNIPEKLGYDEWKKFIRKKYVRDFIPIITKDDNNKDQKSIACIRTLPVEQPALRLATAIITVNGNKLLQSIQNTKLASIGMVAVIDKNDNIIASSSSFSLPQNLTYDKLSEDNDLIYDQLEGKNIMISYIKSQVNDWKLISIIPEGVFWAKVKYIRLLIVICIGLSLSIGGMIAYIYTKKNYDPIKKLIETIVNKLGKSLNNYNNEYNFIQETLSQTLEEKEQINKRLKQQKNQLRSNFMSQLLKGQLVNEVSIEKLLSFDIDLVSDYFSVMLFHIEGYDIAFFNEVDIKATEKSELVQFIMTNIIEELVGQKGQGFMTKVDDMLACLINFNKADVVDGRQEMLKITCKAQQYIEEHFQIDFKVSFSDIHQTIGEIQNAYQEAFETMEYKIVTGGKDIYSYNEIKDLNRSYCYSLQTEQQLINCIKTGDLEKSQAILDDVILKNATETSLPIHMAKRLMFNLISTMIITLDEVEDLCDRELLAKLNPVDKLLNCKTVMEMKLQMFDIMKGICEAVKCVKKSGNNKFIDDVVMFIKNNYCDINFCSSSISDRFEMTSDYISKLFKEQTGGGLLDYINKLRLDQAKLLLKDQELTINDIAKKCGYGDYNTFNRQFKNYEGVTPGKYRMLC